MISVNVRNLFETIGAIISPASSRSLFELAPQKIITLFEEKGAILFRNFDIDSKNLRQFTDIFTESYSGDAYRRAQRFDSKVIRNVDGGAQAVLLHSEASFTPAWPELIWFLCIKPPCKAGSTIVCDGAAVYDALSQETKNFFLLNPIRYDLKIPIEKKIPGKPNHPWMFKVPGAGNAQINWEEGAVNVTQIRPAITEGRKGGMICFANHLIIEMDSEPQLVKRSLIDGMDIPSHIMSEIKKVSDSKTLEITWEAGDLLMLDNKRLMHGRRAFEPGDPRDIVIVQTNRASFGYGSTTRRRIAA